MLTATAALGLVLGVVIGGLGGGGGVLAVPALVYGLGQSAQDATASSVVIVGVTAAVGALARIRGGVDWRIAGAFGVIGIPAAYLGSQLNQRVAEPVLLLAFAVLTLVAAAGMLLDGRRSTTATDREASTSAAGPGGTATAVAARTSTGSRRALERLGKMVVCGLAVGFLTGFLGVGGGFLVVPALVIALRLPMPLAVGTSLLIICINSAASLVSRLGTMHLDWRVVVPFTLAAVVGALVGRRAGDRLSPATLTTSFAVLLVLVGLAVGVQSTLALT